MSNSQISNISKEKIEGLQTIRDTLSISNHILIHDPTQMASQFCGRLLKNDCASVQKLLSGMVSKRDIWLRPLMQSLTSPEGALSLTLSGHTQDVRAMTATSNGKKIITGSFDHTVRIWDAATGVCEAILTEHSGSISKVLVTPDCKQLVSISNDHTIRVWDLQTLTCTGSVSDYGTNYRDTILSGNGHWIIAQYYKEIKIWDINSLVMIHQFEGHPSEIKTIYAAPYSNTLYSASDGVIKQWDLDSGVCKKTITGEEKKTAWGSTWRISINSLFVTPDEKYAITGGNGIRVWDLQDGAEVIEWEGYSSNDQQTTSMSHDGKYFVSAYVDEPGTPVRSMRIWDIHTHELVSTLQGHTEEIYTIVFSLDSTRVISSSRDRTVRIWDVKTGKQLFRLDASASYRHLLPDGYRMVYSTGGQTAEVCRIDRNSGSSENEYHSNSIMQITSIPNSNKFVAAAADNNLSVWDTIEPFLTTKLEGHTESVKACTVTPDGAGIFSASLDTTVRVWNPVIGTCWATLEGHTDGILSIVLSRSGDRAVTGSIDKTARVWNMVTGECLHILSGHYGFVSCAAITPDERIVITGSQDGWLRIYDLAHPEEFQILKNHKGSINALLLTPDGRRFITASVDQTVRIWDVNTSACLATLKGHQGQVYGLAVSPDGRFAASSCFEPLSSKDHTIRIWNLDTYQCDAVLKGHTGMIPSLQISPDNRFIISVSDDRTLRIWNVLEKKCAAVFYTQKGLCACSIDESGSFIAAGDLFGKIHLLRIENRENQDSDH